MIFHKQTASHHSSRIRFYVFLIIQKRDFTFFEETFKKRKPSYDARVTRESHHSKMAISRHFEYYPTGNIAIRSADPENPCLEPNMEWIGCTVCDIIVFKLYCDLETGFGVTQGHRKRHH